MSYKKALVYYDCDYIIHIITLDTFNEDCTSLSCRQFLFSVINEAAHLGQVTMCTWSPGTVTYETTPGSWHWDYRTGRLQFPGSSS